MNQNHQNVFIADLHHPGGRQDEIDQLLGDIPANTHRIFFLGDTFHFWINDHSFIEERYSLFLDQMKQWAHNGIQLFFLEGNRDFLASHYFDEQAWIDVLHNPTITEIGGKVVYLGHGDELCWNDRAYQFYKSIIRSHPLRYLADHLPPGLRARAAQTMTDASKVLVAGKSEKTLEVPRKAYEQVIRGGVDLIIHGHLHETYHREYRIGEQVGQALCFGWKDGKRNLIQIEGI
jgi:UDP-2,3-diacylglucosamine hydrolase